MAACSSSGEASLPHAQSYATRRVPIPAVGIFLIAVALFWALRGLWSGLGLAGVAAAEWVAFMLAPGLLIRRLGGRWREATRFRVPGPRPLVAGAVLGLAGPPIAWLVHQIQSIWLAGEPGLPEVLGRELVTSGSGHVAAFLFLAVITPAVCEETLCRGVLLRGLHGRAGSAAAIAATALAFGALHWVPGSSVRVMPAVAVGVVLGWAAIRGGSLLVAMIAHLVHNLAIVSLALTVPDRAAGVSPLLVALSGVAFILLGSQLLSEEARPETSPRPSSGDQ